MFCTYFIENFGTLILLNFFYKIKVIMMFFGDIVRQKVLLSIFSYILLEFWIKVAGKVSFHLNIHNNDDKLNVTSCKKVN